ncbi:sensor histidine kinase [Hyphococcus sp.]|uniref:sensor histidine kinase n=1 Tax=Hyphococcus sp. TaxID=2038636 RepID=UPI0035C71E5D
MTQGLIEAATGTTEKATLERRELHHRISNSLQIVVAFLRLKRNHITPETALEALEKAADRIDAIGHFHRYVAENDSDENVSFKDLARYLMADICTSVGLECRVEGDDIPLSVDKALNLIIIINELAINSHKHAYDNRDGGEFVVRCKRCDDEIVVTVSDSGKGLPHNFSLEEHQGLGFEVIASTVERLGGWLECEDRARGAAFRFAAPID